MLCCHCSEIFSVPSHGLPHLEPGTSYSHQPSMATLKMSTTTCLLCELIWHLFIQQNNGCEPSSDDSDWQAPVIYEFKAFEKPVILVRSGSKSIRLQTLSSACRFAFLPQDKL